MIFKRIIVSVLISLLIAMPIAANGDVLLSVYPHFTMPVGKETHSINYGIGGGAKLLFRPIKYFETGIYGDYFNLNIPSISPISVFDAGVTAGYILPLNDRFNLNFDLEAGVYRAVQTKSFNSIEVGVSASFTYKIRPAVSVGMGTSFAHYAAGKTALINGITVSPSATFNLTEAINSKSKLKMDTKDILPVFPVLYSWYERNRFATITITNQENATIENVKVSFYQPQYMGHPNVCIGSDEKIRLRSGDAIDVDLTAFFNERMLEMTEKSDTQAIISVEYTYMGEKRVQEFAMIIPVYGRNSMSWADDRRAAVFVSSKDPAAMFYSKYVTSIIRENMRIGVPQNIQYALGIFNSLAEFGINYVIDPSSAYTDNVGTETPDFLQFPYQTLSYRGGDCDDLSILMCSLLEAVGVDTAFITIPGHIYMAFNLGLDVEKTKEQFGSLDNFIVIENEVWVPLEITVTDEGFNRAWQLGAREWRTAERDGTAAIYRMKDSWEIYKPVSVPGAAVTFTMPEKNQLATSFANGVDAWILREIEDKVEAYKKYIARTGDIKAQNTLGAIYGKYGLFDLAEEQLSSPVKNGYVPAMLNSANVQFAKKNYYEAEQMYKNVIRHDRTNAVAYLGVARCCYEQENFDECDLAYLVATQLDPEIVSSYAYLGSFESTTGRAYNLADRLSYTIWLTDEVDLSEVIIDEAVEKRVAELREFYGELANNLIEKTKSSAPSLPTFAEIIDFPLKKNDDDVTDYFSLPKQIAILPPDDILALLKPDNEIALPEVPKRDDKPEQLKRVKIELAPAVYEVAVVEPPLVPTIAELPKPPVVIEEKETLPAVVEPALVPMVVEETQTLPAVVEVVAEVPMVVEETQTLPAVVEIAEVPAIVEEQIEVPPVVEEIPVSHEVVLQEENFLTVDDIETPAVVEIAEVSAIVEEQIEVPPVAEEIAVSHEVVLQEENFLTVDDIEPPVIEESFPTVDDIENPAVVETPAVVEVVAEVPMVVEEQIEVTPIAEEITVSHEVVLQEENFPTVDDIEIPAVVETPAVVEEQIEVPPVAEEIPVSHEVVLQEENFPTVDDIENPAVVETPTVIEDSIELPPVAEEIPVSHEVVLQEENFPTVDDIEIPAVVETPAVVEIAEVPAVVEESAELPPVAEEIPVSHEVVLQEENFLTVDDIELPAIEENFPTVDDIALPPVEEPTPEPPVVVQPSSDNAQLDRSVNWILPVCIAGGLGLLTAIIIIAAVSAKNKKEEDKEKHD